MLVVVMVAAIEFLGMDVCKCNVVLVNTVLALVLASVASVATVVSSVLVIVRVMAMMIVMTITLCVVWVGVCVGRTTLVNMILVDMMVVSV